MFCHDDVAPAPDAIRLMVEEAFRSNAGVVAPKLVDWDDPMRLLQVGLGADKSGAPAELVEAGELDQEQHDAVRDIFWAPGGFTLVRADLFATLGGFDAVMGAVRRGPRSVMAGPGRRRPRDRRPCGPRATSRGNVDRPPRCAWRDAPGPIGP